MNREEALPQDSEMNRGIGMALVIGVSLFITLAYLPFSVGNLVATNKFNFILTVSSSFIVTGVLTISSAILTRSPLAIVTPLGTTFLILPFLQDRLLDLWVVAATSCIAGIIVFITAISQWRKKLLESLPEEIILGVRAAVGSLVADQAMRLVRFYSPSRVQDTPNSVFLIFITGVLAMLLWDRVPTYLIRKGKLAPKNDPKYILVQLHYILIPAIIVAVLYFGLVDGHVPETSYASFGPSAYALFPQTMMAIPLLIVLVYILLTDVPGHPFEILRDPSVYAYSFRKKEEIDKCVSSAFCLDGASALIAGSLIFFGLIVPPAIYVSENNAVRDFDWENGGGGIVAGILFGMSGLILFIFPILIAALAKFIFLAVAPVLFFISLKMIARSMVREAEVEHRSSSQTDAPFVKFKTHSLALDTYLPTALMILITSYAGLGLIVALPIGVVTAIILRKFRNEVVEGPTWVLFWLSVTSMFFWTMVTYGRTEKPDNRTHTGAVAPRKIDTN